MSENLKTIKELADEFNVSKQAVRKRLTEEFRANHVETVTSNGVKTLVVTYIFNYAKTRDIYTDYRKAGYSKKFYEEHRAELTLHKAAKTAFEELGVKKLPTIKALQAECDELFSVKNKAYSKYHTARKEMQDILTAKANIDRLLGMEQEQKAKEKSQDQR